MSLSKITKNLDINDLYRFRDGWCKSGAQVRPKDTRNPEQLCKFMDGLAEKYPSLKEFVKDLKTMNPKHLSLAADTMEIATTHSLVAEGMSVPINKVNPTIGKSLTECLLGAFPKASKENPHALEFMQEVINNTDRKTIEYVLAELPDVIDKPQLGEHLKAVQPMIKDIAEQTIGSGFPRMDFEPQQNFMQFIKAMVNSDNNPKKISLLTKLIEAVDKCPADVTIPITMNKFTASDAPIQRVVDNIEILPEIATNAIKQGKSFDVVDFVNNNINLY